MDNDQLVMQDDLRLINAPTQHNTPHACRLQAQCMLHTHMLSTRCRALNMHDAVTAVLQVLAEK
jgi:hypothetical protein